MYLYIIYHMTITQFGTFIIMIVSRDINKLYKM